MYEQFEFNSAREGLGYLIRTCGIKCMHIPYYLCDAVRHTLVLEGCKPLFYHIDDDFYPLSVFPEGDYILYPNYFGICTNNVKKLVSLYPNLIVDNAHAFYEKPEGFACFNAGHKFGFLESKLWIKTEKTKQKKYYAEEDYTSEIEFRLKQFCDLHEKYKNTNLIKIDINSIISPFVYPFLAETEYDADFFVKQLAGHGKTIYRYWNLLPKSFNEYKFYSRLVPVPLCNDNKLVVS